MHEHDGRIARAGTMKTLLVSPQAGMCNRFRVLCSAVLLARMSGRKLYHCWEKEAPHTIDMEHIQHMRESSFDSFFAEDTAIPFRAVDATTAIDQVFSEWGPGDFWYATQSSAMQRCGWGGEIHIERSSADDLLKSQADTVLLETSLCLRPSSLGPDEFEQALSDIYNQHFKPLPLFQKIVEKFALGGPYVGVHIRRTDHLRYVRAADISAKNWETIIRRYVATSEAIYFCSDDEAFVKAVTARLPEYRIVPVDQTLSHTPKFQAFIEFLCLSKAVRIYGTVGSGFSREASRFGGLPFVLCSVKQPENIWERMLCCLGMGAQQVACTELPGPFSGSAEII